MSQTRRMSLAESVVNVCVGVGIAYGLNLWLLPVTPREAAGLSVLFTAVSLARSYTIRRLFA